MRASDIIVRSTHSSSDLTIASIVAILRQRRYIIVLTTCAIILLVAIYCLVATPRYKSTGVIEVQKNSNDLLSLDSLIATQSGEMGDALNASLDLQTQVEILQSDTLALQVINDLSLEKTRDFKPHWSPIGAVLGFFSSRGVVDPPSAALEDAPQRRNYVTKVFSNHLKVKPVAGTRLIEVSFTNSDSKVAAAVVNDLMRALMDRGFTTRNSATNETSEWLGHQLNDLKKQAHDLQAKVVDLQRYTGIYSLGEDSQGHDQVYSSTLDQLQQATTALSGATSSRIVKGALYDTISHGDPEMISSLAGTSMGASSSSVQNSLTLLQNLRTAQATAAAQLAQDTSKFGSDYPKLADERSNLASIDKAVNDEIHRVGERAKNDFEAARTTEDKLKAVYDDRKQEAGKLNDRATEYSIAKQEADNSRSLYEDLSKRLKEAGIIEGLRSSNISVVSPGRVSPKPYSPYAPLYLAAAALLGLFFGACGALYSDMTDPTLQSFGVVEESLGVTFFAVLPTLVKRGLKNLLSIPDNARSYAKRSAELMSPLVVLDKPNSAFAEALRRMRMSLLSSHVASTPKVILVTSSVRGEGKTTVAVNIAALLAQTGKRVLFVESDLRRPGSGSTHLFDPSQDSVPGLTELLSNPGLIMKANQIKGAPGMQVLPSGPSTVYPTELLSTDRMRTLLDRWKLEFDHIVMDSPSLLDVTDALILSRLADITLLVARYGFTSNKSLERAYRMLASDSDTRIGVVLNAADRNSVSYSDYYGYSGSTYYQIS
jgi:succinoglycan biosynthesis transport protein ExoP